MAPSEDTSSNTTQIPIPTSLNSETTSLPPLTHHLLASNLRQTGALSDLSVLLTDSLARTGWTDRIRALALELLRQDKCKNFPELLEKVLERTRPSGGSSSTSTGKNGASGSATGGKSIHNGTGASSGPTSAPGSQATAVNGAGAIAIREGWFGADGLPDVKIPQATVDAAIEFLVEKIKDLCEGVDDKD